MKLIRWLKELLRKPCEHKSHNKMLIFRQVSFLCDDCGYWGPWHERPRK